MDDITKATKAEVWKKYHSTKQRRIVLLSDQTPLRVPPIGVFRPPMIFRDYNRLMFIAIGPHREAIYVRSTLLTKDGVHLSGEIRVEFLIGDSEPALMQLAANPAGQHAIFTDRVLASAQRLVAQYTYLELDALRIESGEKFTDDFNNNKGSSSFQLIGVHLNELDTPDEQLRESRLREAQAVETKSLELKKSQLQAEIAKQEAEATRAAVKIDLEIQRLRQEQALDLDRKKTQQDLALLKQKADLLDTEAGFKAVDTKAWLELEKEKLRITEIVAELEDRRDRDMIKASMSYQAGQNQVLRQVVGKRHGLDCPRSPKVHHRWSLSEGSKCTTSGA